MEQQQEKKGFGTFKGVFTPSILTILGVILYLRLGWVVGNVGLIGTLLIVTMASTITFLTGLSIAATATNMKVGSGGAYYMVSRSFGVEAGAAVGIPLFFAQTIGVAFYIAGFAESLKLIFPFIPAENIGFIVLIILTIIAYFSADLALKTQLLIFAIIAASLISFFLGSPLVEEAPKTIATTPNTSFWLVFAVFFPAVTGIEAGISLSGNLKDPSRSLPRGTLAAIIVGYIIYLIIPIILYNYASTTQLKNNSLLMKDISLFPALFYLGIWGATLSSAMGALLGAPRTLQALSLDRVTPRFIGKSFGAGKEPRIATMVTFLIAAAVISMGGINVIAPVLSMFFLTSYGALNLIAGFEGMIANPSWRPTFKTPWYVSLIASLLCLCTMMLINAGASFVALLACVVIYFLMKRRRLNARWSDMRRSLLQFLARTSIYHLAESNNDARSWRPNMLVFSGAPTSRWYLIELADAITQGKGFLTVAAIVSDNYAKEEKKKNLEKSIKEFLKTRRVPALVKIKQADNFIPAAKSLIGDYGLGPVAPNTMLFGDTEKRENYNEFTELIINIFKSQKNSLIVRHGEREEQKETKEKTARKIDVWWGRLQNNAPLMLTLAYMLQGSPEWAGSTINLKTLVSNEEERQGVEKSLKEFIANSRIELNIKIYDWSDKEEPLNDIEQHSKDADIVFLGLRAPQEDEAISDYARYYSRLIASSNQLPLTILTLAGEEVEFKDIFA